MASISTLPVTENRSYTPPPKEKEKSRPVSTETIFDPAVTSSFQSQAADHILECKKIFEKEIEYLKSIYQKIAVFQVQNIPLESSNRVLSITQTFQKRISSLNERLQKLFDEPECNKYLLSHRICDIEFSIISRDSFILEANIQSIQEKAMKRAKAFDSLSDIVSSCLQEYMYQDSSVDGSLNQ